MNDFEADKMAKVNEKKNKEASLMIDDLKSPPATTGTKKKHGQDTPTENLMMYSESMEAKRLEPEFWYFQMDQEFRSEQLHLDSEIRRE